VPLGGWRDYTRRRFANSITKSFDPFPKTRYSRMTKQNTPPEGVGSTRRGLTTHADVSSMEANLRF
jgi:hypothetical protein